MKDDCGKESPIQIGICKECLSDVPLIKENEVAEGIYECKNCDYPNGIRNGDFWEIYIKDG